MTSPLRSSSVELGPGRSPLDLVRDEFASLVAGPHPLGLDGRALADLPDRSIPLDELRDLLLRRRCRLATRDVVWAHLVTQARASGGDWTIACVGMALPALGPVCRWMGARFPGDPHDIHAEVLSGFLRGLASVDLDRPGIMLRLRWTAFRAGHAALHEALDAPTPAMPGFRSFPPPTPWGHPDLVLARAIRWGVLNRTEADLIGTTRLDKDSIADWAVRNRTTVAAAYKARSRAESRLIAFLCGEVRDADPDDPVASRIQAELAPARADGRRRTVRQGQRTRSVTSGRGRTSGARVGERLSNFSDSEGFPVRGGTPPTVRPALSSEARRCA